MFARQGDQPQVGLCRGPRPVVANEVAEVVGAVGIAAFFDHAVEATGGEGREFLQGLADEGEVGINTRWTQRRADAWQAGLAQNAFDAAMTDMQLSGNGANGPFLDMMERRIWASGSGGRAMGRFYPVSFERNGEPAGVEMPYERIPFAADDRNDSARAAAIRFLHTTLGSPAVEQA